MNRLIKGLLLIENTIGTLEYDFSHDTMWVGISEDMDPYTINELWNLGFYINDENDSFITFS